MSEEDGEQQELSDVEADTASRTRQEQIIKLYNADKLPHVAAGYWMKLLVEAMIVSVPIGVVAGLGLILVWLDIGPFSYLDVLAWWVVFSTSMLTFSWCLTESAISTDDESSDAESEETQD